MDIMKKLFLFLIIIFGFVSCTYQQKVIVADQKQYPSSTESEYYENEDNIDYSSYSIFFDSYRRYSPLWDEDWYWRNYGYGIRWNWNYYNDWNFIYYYNWYPYYTYNWYWNYPYTYNNWYFDYHWNDHRYNRFDDNYYYGHRSNTTDIGVRKSNNRKINLNENSYDDVYHRSSISRSNVDLNKINPSNTLKRNTEQHSDGLATRVYTKPNTTNNSTTRTYNSNTNSSRSSSKTYVPSRSSNSYTPSKTSSATRIYNPSTSGNSSRSSNTFSSPSRSSSGSSSSRSSSGSTRSSSGSTSSRSSSGRR